MKIWQGESTLKKVLTTTIEEELFHLLLTTVVKCSISISNNTEKTNNNLDIASKLIRQLTAIERFQTTFHLTLYGNEELKFSLEEALEKILIFNQNRKKSVLDLIQLDGVADEKEEEMEKRRKKIKIDILKNTQAVMEVKSLLK